MHQLQLKSVAIHIQEQPINPTLFASGIRKSTNRVNVDSGTIPSSTKISVTLSASTIVFSVPGGMLASNSLGRS